MVSVDAGCGSESHKAQSAQCTCFAALAQRSGRRPTCALCEQVLSYDWAVSCCFNARTLGVTSAEPYLNIQRPRRNECSPGLRPKASSDEAAKSPTEPKSPRLPFAIEAYRQDKMCMCCMFIRPARSMHVHIGEMHTSPALLT